MTLADRLVTAGLSLLMLSGLAWGVGATLLPDVYSAWSSAGHDEDLLRVGLLMLLGSGWLAVVARAGPHAMSTRAQQWQVEAPRLRPGVLTTTVAAIIGVAVVGVLVVLPASDVSAPAPWVRAAAWSTGLLALAVVAEQAQRRGALELRRHLVWILGAAGSGAVAASRGDVLLALCGAAVVVGCTVSLLARRARPGFRTVPARWALAEAAENRAALHAGVVLLDGEAVRAPSRRRRARPRVAPGGVWVAGGPSLTRVLVLTARLLPTALLVAACTAYVAVCAVDVADTSAAAGVIALGVAAVTAATGRTLDRWSGAPALSRTYVSCTSRGRVVPSVIAAFVVVLVGVLAVWPGVHVAATLLTLPIFVVKRREVGRRPQGVLALATGAGVLPLDVLNRMVAGWDVALIAVAAVALLGPI